MCTITRSKTALETLGIRGRRVGLLTILLATIGVLPPLSAAAQQTDGERLFRQKCTACHSLEAGQKRTGPHLSGIIGRSAGSAKGASYSRAMQSSEITWDRSSLDQFLASPGQVVRGTRMSVSVANAAQRAAIIDYLENQPTE